MCFHSKQSKTALELQHRFKATINDSGAFKPAVYNAFQHPKTPIITNKEPDKIQLCMWGLIPFWAKNDQIKKYTLNARIETLDQKPSFRNSVKNRCLVLADGFYEWQWLDPKGTRKQKFELNLPESEAFGFAGLWSEWVDKATGEMITSYTVLTMKANELMSTIHNSKKRMPIIVSKESEKNWLEGGILKIQNDRLVAEAITY